MDDENSGSVDGVVHTAIQSAKAQLASMSTGVQLALAELRVVVSHAGLIVCLVMVAAGMAIVGWGLILVFGALVLISLGLSASMAVLGVFLLNTIALFGIVFFIRDALKHLSFKHTRQALNPESAEAGYSS